MRASYRPIIILIFITAVSYLSVDIFYKILVEGIADRGMPGISVEESAKRQQSRKKIPLQEYRVISERNLFGSAQKEAEKAEINIEELKQTELKLTLLGTVAGNGNNSYAVIEEKEKRKQGLYKVGDSVDRATIKEIRRGMVVIRVDNRDEILLMEEKIVAKKETAAAEASSGGTPITVSKEEIDDALQDMNKMMTEVRIRPYFTQGKPDGFMVSRIKSGSIFSKMGMKNGDVIQGVNNQPIGSAEDMLTLYQELKSGSEILLNIKRRGQEETLRYVFE